MAKGQIKQKQSKIDKEQFENLCAINRTAKEICKHFNVGLNTLKRWCQETYNCDFGTFSFVYKKIREPEKKGRPRIHIDKEQFEKLCTVHLPEKVIADFFHCSEDTVNEWCKRTYKQTFKEKSEELQAGGKASLAYNQLRLSETNASMGIWLGKQWLAQRDTLNEESTKSDNQIRFIKASEDK